MKKPISLSRKLFAEILQTERSAKQHGTVEAERLGNGPPASALRAVAEHARIAEHALRSIAERRQYGSTQAGSGFGSLFSIIRNWFADFMLTAEQSYRGTLLGMRHGYDAVSLFRAASRVDADEELAEWCDAWLRSRAPLIEAVAAALGWFAENPELAVTNAKRHRPGQEQDSTGRGATPSRVE
jgi:hypothetical protein